MAVRKTKSGLALKRWFKEDWKDVRTKARRVGVARVKNGVLHIVAPLKGYRQKPPKTSGAYQNRKAITHLSKEAYWPTGR